MDIDIGMWTPWRRLYERDGISVVLTAEPGWVVKHACCKSAIQKEINFLREGYPIRNMIEIPADSVSQFGENWYAMRRYAGSVYDNITEVRGRWRQIGLSVLDFLEDLHREVRCAHLDVTLKNILYDREGSRFVISDYELLEPIDSETAMIDDNDDHLWYYIGAGAELSKPIRSWRMDLSMLGYCLEELLRGDRHVTFVILCRQRRSDTHMSISDYDIIVRRNKEMEGCHPAVRAYLDRLKAIVSWDDVNPPAASVYNELRALLAVAS